MPLDGDVYQPGMTVLRGTSGFGSRDANLYVVTRNDAHITLNTALVTSSAVFVHSLGISVMGNARSTMEKHLLPCTNSITQKLCIYVAMH